MCHKKRFTNAVAKLGYKNIEIKIFQEEGGGGEVNMLAIRNF